MWYGYPQFNLYNTWAIKPFPIAKTDNVLLMPYICHSNVDKVGKKKF